MISKGISVFLGALIMIVVVAALVLSTINYALPVLVAVVSDFQVNEITFLNSIYVSTVCVGWYLFCVVIKGAFKSVEESK